MKKLLPLEILLCATVTALAQKPSKDAPTFDVADFNRKFEIVQRLVEYDEVAWKTSDVVMTEPKEELARLGAEWFCFRDDKKLWHAVYGKLANGKYDAVFHYTFDSTGKIARSREKVDQKFLDGHAQALATGLTKLFARIPPDSPRFNQYIERNADGTFGVWLLPAFQPDGTAVYGGEAYYHIDSAGLKVLKEETYFQPNFRGFKASPPREIWLNYNELEKPTLGTIFCVDKIVRFPYLFERIKNGETNGSFQQKPPKNLGKSA